MAKKTVYQIACQLYSMRDLMKNEKQAATTLKKIRRIGFRNVQVSGPSANFDPMDTKKMCDDAGLKIIGAHIGIEAMEEDLVAVIDKLHLWDCSYVAIPSYKWGNTKASAWKTLARKADKIGKALLAEGIHLQYHNHAFELMKFGRKGISGGKTGLEILYDNSDPRYLQSEIDTCWIARGGGDPAAWVRAMKGRSDQVHIKDMVIVNNEPVFCAIGEGNLNWPEIMKACKYSRVKDYIVEQDSFPISKSPLKSMEVSYKNLRKMGLK